MRIILISLIFILTATAHDTGFGHSSRTLHIATTPTGYTIEYRLKINSDQAVLEFIQADTNRDGNLSDTERDTFFQAKAKKLLSGLKCNDSQLNVSPASAVQLDNGLTQTYILHLTSQSSTITLTDHNFAHKHGRVTIYHTPDITVTSATGHDDPITRFTFSRKSPTQDAVDHP